MVFTVLALVAGGVALARYAVGVVQLARFLRRARVASIPKGETPPLSLLKPLYGVDPGLEENLVATLRQNYPAFEVLFLHERPDDPALGAARAAAAAVPDVPVRFVAGRVPDAANPKAAVLAVGEGEAKHALLVAADADVRPDPLYLRDVANGLAVADVVSFVPVLFGAKTIGARLAALVVDTDGLLAVLLAGGRVTAGATIGVRRDALVRAGGWRAVGDRIADDHALGVALRAAGGSLVLARRAARIHQPGGDLRETARWVTRWARTVRVAAGGWFALGAVSAFAPLSLLAAAVAGARPGTALAMLAAHTVLRALVAVAVDLRFCWDRSLVRSLHLLPVLWLVEPVATLAALCGSTVSWRGRRYRIKGGRATLLAP